MPCKGLGHTLNSQDPGPGFHISLCGLRSSRVHLLKPDIHCISFPALRSHDQRDCPMTMSSKTLLPEAGHPQGRSSQPFRVNFQSPSILCVSCKGRPLASLSLSEPGKDSWGESTLHIFVSVSHPPLRLPVIPLSTRGQKGYCEENPILQLGAHHPTLLQEADGVHSI